MKPMRKPTTSTKMSPQSDQTHHSSIQALTLVAMCLALFMTNLDDTVVNVALPKIQSSFGVPLSGLQWVLNAYTLPLASLVLPSGAAGDVYGRKRIFLVGLVLFIVASLVCGFAPTLSILIAGRVLQGIGAAALIPGSLVLLVDAFSDLNDRTKAIGVWCAVSGLALIAGPALGGLLVDTLGWQSIFFLNLPLGIITFWLTLRFVQELHRSRQRRLDLPGIVLSILFLSTITYALTENHSGAWVFPLFVGFLIVAGVSLAAFIMIETRSPNPMLPLHLFKIPTFTIVTVVQVLVFFTIVSLLFIFSLFLQQVQGYSATEAGLRFLPLNGAFIAASFVSGWLAARLGWRVTIATGLIGAGIATLSFIQINPDTEYSAIWGKLLLSGFGGGLTLSPLAAAAMSSVSSAQSGIAAALLNTSTRLGSVLGITIQGNILEWRLTSHLTDSLMTWNLPSTVRDQIIAQALQNVAEISGDLPSNISLPALQQVIRQSFVSGVHATVMTASLCLLTGAALILIFVPSISSSRLFRGSSKG
jgi:MFS transporter, DHA2 family, methylenomycin A resistance protein